MFIISDENDYFNSLTILITFVLYLALYFDNDFLYKGLNYLCIFLSAL